MTPGFPRLRVLLAAAWVAGCVLGATGHAISAPAPESGEIVIERNGVVLRVSGIDSDLVRGITEVLTDQITLSGDTSPREPLADDLAFFARQFLAKRGHPRAVVRWTLQPPEIRLDAVTGPRVSVGEVTVEADIPVDEDELRDLFLQPTKDNPENSRRTLFWVDSNIQSGVAQVRQKLRADGWLQAEAEWETTAGEGELERPVLVRVVAGPRFTLGRVAVEGAPPEIAEQVEALMEEVRGGPFSPAAMQQLETRLTSLARQRGWLEAETVSFYPLPSRGGSVPARFVMLPGPRPVIGAVLPDPEFSRGAARVLRATFKPLLGSTHSTERAAEAYRRALDTGIFATLNESVLPRELDDSGDPAAEHSLLADLHLYGTETPRSTLSLEGALDTFLGVQIGFTYRNHNFHDSGRALALSANYSLAGPTGFVSYTDSALFDSPYSATARLFGDSFFRYEYTRYTIGLGLELVRRVSRRFTWSTYVDASVSTVSSDLPPLFTGPDDYGYITPGVSVTFDYRDSPTLPANGWFATARVEYNHDGLGEGASFLRQAARATWLKRLDPRWRVAVGAAAERVTGAAFSEIPIDLRVFNGGPNSVRAFPMRELGPVTAGGTPLGGTGALYGGVEFSREIVTNLELAAFCEAGSLDLEQSSNPFAFSSDFRPSIGLGLRYLLPFGPLRMDYGYNLDRRAGESAGMLHVTAGFAF